MDLKRGVEGPPVSAAVHGAVPRILRDLLGKPAPRRSGGDDDG